MADKFILMKDRYGALNRCFHRSIRAQENNLDTVKLDPGVLTAHSALCMNTSFMI